MRKKPQQRRSKQLVESLLEAGLRVIAREGLEGCTALRIADEAGVSVGSFYQYFDSKEALYEAALARLGEELKALTARQVSQLEGREIGDFVCDVLDEVWALLEANDKRYLHILRYWAQLDFRDVVNDLERHMQQVLALYMVQRAVPTPVEDAAAKIYVLVNSMLFTLVRYISDPVPHIRREDIVKTFGELVRSQVGPALAPRRVSPSRP